MTRITINVAGQPLVVLADWDDVVLDNPTLDPQFELQVVKYFRGPTVALFDRANVMTTYQFTLAKLWNTLEAALDWHDNVGQKIPRQGDVTKQQRGYTGGVTTRTMSGAAIRVKSLANAGVTTYTQVSIIGGRWT